MHPTFRLLTTPANRRGMAATHSHDIGNPGGCRARGGRLEVSPDAVACGPGSVIGTCTTNDTLGLSLGTNGAQVKLLAEPWDCGMYQVGTFPNWDVWGEWNGKFRDDFRCAKLCLLCDRQCMPAMWRRRAQCVQVCAGCLQAVYQGRRRHEEGYRHAHCRFSGPVPAQQQVWQGTWELLGQAQCTCGCTLPVSATRNKHWPASATTR